MQSIEARGQNFATTSGLLTATGAETVHDTTVTITFCVNGKAYTKTAITDGTTPTTDYNSGSSITLTANYGRCVVWALTSGGVVKCMAGATVAWDGTAFAVPPPFPPIPDDVTPFAYQILKGGSTLSGTWTFGSSNWNATGLTSSIQNVLVLPARPQTA